MKQIITRWWLVTLLTTLEWPYYITIISIVVHRKMWNSASLKFCHGSVMFDQVAERNKNKNNIDQTRHFSQLIAIQKADWYTVICGEENGLLTNPYCQFWQFCLWHNVLVLFQNPARQAQTDMAVSLWVSQAKYQLYLQSLSWPFCSDSPEWCSAHMCTQFWCHGDAFVMTENAFFRAFITLRSQLHLHHRSQRAVRETVSKITPNLGLVL